MTTITFGSVCSGIEAASVAWNPRMRDLAGTRSGRLMVLAPSYRADDGHVMWACLCDCGKSKAVSSNSLTRKSPVQSCGCMNKTTAQAKVRANGAWNEGKSYVIRDGEHCYRTRHGWAKAAIRHFGNACMECGWDKARCDVHHRIPKANGGPHTIANAWVLCHNCHRVHHEQEAE